MAGLCSAHRQLNLECELCRSVLPEVLKLYLVVDIYDSTVEVVVKVFFTKEEALTFTKKSRYPFLLKELEFNTQNGEAQTT